MCFSSPRERPSPPGERRPPRAGRSPSTERPAFVTQEGRAEPRRLIKETARLQHVPGAKHEDPDEIGAPEAVHEIRRPAGPENASRVPDPPQPLDLGDPSLLGEGREPVLPGGSSVDQDELQAVPLPRVGTRRLRSRLRLVPHRLGPGLRFGIGELPGLSMDPELLLRENDDCRTGFRIGPGQDRPENRAGHVHTGEGRGQTQGLPAESAEPRSARQPTSQVPALRIDPEILDPEAQGDPQESGVDRRRPAGRRRRRSAPEGAIRDPEGEGPDRRKIPEGPRQGIDPRGNAAVTRLAGRKPYSDPPMEPPVPGDPAPTDLHRDFAPDWPPGRGLPRSLEEAQPSGPRLPTRGPDEDELPHSVQERFRSLERPAGQEAQRKKKRGNPSSLAPSKAFSRSSSCPHVRPIPGDPVLHRQRKGPSSLPALPRAGTEGWIPQPRDPDLQPSR